MSDRFWAELQTLVATHDAVIDRPAGSRHPDFAETVYRHDYGELVGSSANDGEPIDVFLGSGDRASVCALVVIFDPVKSQIEPKLVLGAVGGELDEIVHFLETDMHLPVLRIDRPDGSC